MDGTIAGMTEFIPNTAPVSDVLLSLAKDDRYIDELSTMLGLVIAPYACLCSQADDDRIQLDAEVLKKIRPELDLLASVIIYSATYVACYIHGRGKSLQSSTQNDGGQRRSVGMESLNLAYRGEAKRWHALLFLQTIAPYVIHRVERGGWSKDLGGAVHIVMDRLGLAYPKPSVFRTTNNEEEDLRNDDRLRGSARRRLFLGQRRRMLDSSNDTSGNENGSVETTISRIRDQSALINANSVNHGLTCLRSLGDNERLERISTAAWNFMRRVSLAVSSLSNGAYSLPRPAGSTTNINLDRYAAIIKWSLRLHLSLFYWNGMYPTFAHRLVGANIRDDVVPVDTSDSSSYSSTTLGSIVANRPSYKPIAAILFFQAAIALSKTTAEASIEVAHYIQLCFFRWRRRRRRRMQQQQSGSNITLNDSDLSSNTINVEREEYMDMIEDCIPGISSSSLVVANSSSTSRQKQSGQRGHQCGICLNERVHPAAPTACGHVFCWNCVQHWVSNVRAECPLCRAETRPQDIMPLYNYP